MKKLVVGLLIGAIAGMTFPALASSQADGPDPTTEERLQQLESVVSGATSTVTADTVRIQSGVVGTLSVGSASAQRLTIRGNLADEMRLVVRGERLIARFDGKSRVIANFQN